MSTELANFLFEFVNFGLLTGGLGWLLFRPARSALDAEKKRRQDEEKALAARRATLEQEEKELQAKRKEFEEELESQKSQVVESAHTQAEEILKAAREEAQKHREEQVRSRELERGELLAGLADSVALVTSTSLQKLLESLDGPELDLALVRAACDEVDTLRPAIEGRAIVESARPLTDSARELLDDHLPQGFAQRDAPHLGAGVRITTSQGLVDASSLALAAQAAKRVAGAVVTVEDRNATSD